VGGYLELIMVCCVVAHSQASQLLSLSLIFSLTSFFIYKLIRDMERGRWEEVLIPLPCGNV